MHTALPPPTAGTVLRRGVLLGPGLVLRCISDVLHRLCGRDTQRTPGVQLVPVPWPDALPPRDLSTRQFLHTEQVRALPERETLGPRLATLADPQLQVKGLPEIGATMQVVSQVSYSASFDLSSTKGHFVFLNESRAFLLLYYTTQ